MANPLTELHQAQQRLALANDLIREIRDELEAMTAVDGNAADQLRIYDHLRAVLEDSYGHEYEHAPRYWRENEQAKHESRRV